MPRSLPNLGEDIETEQTISSLTQAEKEERHKLATPVQFKEPITEYAQ